MLYVVPSWCHICYCNPLLVSVGIILVQGLLKNSESVPWECSHTPISHMLSMPALLRDYVVVLRQLGATTPLTMALAEGHLDQQDFSMRSGHMMKCVLASK